MRNVYTFLVLSLILIFLNANTAKSDMNNKKGEVIEAESLVMVDEVIGTNYNPEPRQTDSSPDKTADGSKIDMSNPSKHRWIALSRDLIYNDFRNEKYPKEGHWQGQFKFGDTITVIHKDIRLCGYWVVHDCMNARYSKRVDFLQGKDGIKGKWENVILVMKSK